MIRLRTRKDTTTDQQTDPTTRAAQTETAQQPVPRRLPALAAAAAAGMVGFTLSGLAPRRVEATYTPGTDLDNVDTNLRVQGGLTVYGNIAAGMTDASNRLHVRAPGDQVARFEFYGTPDIYVWLREQFGPVIDYGRTGDVNLHFRSSIDGTTFVERLALQNGGTVAMAVNGGNVGVGTGVPVAKLEVMGDARVNGTVNVNGTTAIDSSGVAMKSYYAP